MLLNHALKEWSVAVDALTEGKTILLLRKGGIREVGNRFQVPYQQVWLYPTYEHQKPHLLKPQWTDQVNTVTAGWHPAHISLKSWANIAQVWTIHDKRSVEALLRFHIWNEQFVIERFRWKPSQPLHLLLLRVYRLTTPIQIDWHEDHGGCRSWLTLASPLETIPSTAAIGDQMFEQTAQQIRDQIAEFETLEP